MFFGLNDVAFLAAVSAPAVVLDPDAAAYIAAVEAADTQALEPAVRTAINDFVVGCKADGIWGAIKASCILAGARTLSGALVPLVGTAPTNFNFAAGDYNRKTGLVGDGSTKYLDSGRASNSDPLDNVHQSCYISAVPTNATTALIGAGAGSETPQIAIHILGDRHRNRSNGAISRSNVVGLVGTSRSTSSGYASRTGGSSFTHPLPSESSNALTHFIFARSGSSLLPSNARLSFYSIGESLDLALLDARVTALINAFDAAI
jgi:hypothetical protein